MKQCYLRIFILSTILFIFLVSGCEISPEPKSKSVNIPEWLNSTPHDNQFFYAIGLSGQTRKVKDAWNQAIYRARAELGQTVVTHVRSHNLVVSSNENEYSQQLIEALSDTELNFTEVIERWYDREGDYGPSNYYYVLVRLEKKRAEMILKKLK